MVAFVTVSVQGLNQREQYPGFHEVLRNLFPLVHEHPEKTEIDGNLLFFPEGPLPRPASCADVPSGRGSRPGEWHYPPFSGTIAEGKVWRRSAADTKASLMRNAISDLLTSIGM